MATVPEFKVTASEFQATADPKHPKIVITKKERRLQLLKLCVVAFFSVTTVVLTLIDVSATVKIYRQKQQLKKNIKKSIETASLIHNLQKERGLSALVWAFEISDSKEYVKQLEKVRKNTDESVLVLTDGTGLNGTEVWNADAFLKILNNFRAKLDDYDGHNIQVADQLNTYSAWINQLISWIPQYTASGNLENYANLVFAYQMIIQSKEEAGMERALGGLHFIQGKNFSISSSSWYNEKRIQAKNTLSTAFSFSYEVKNSYHSLIKESNATLWMNEIEEKRQILCLGNISQPSQDNALEWFELMTLYSKLMLELQKRDGHRIKNRVNNKLKQTAKSLVIRCLLLCFTLVVVPCIIFSLVKVQNAFYKYTMTLFHKVGLEQARTDFLMRENSRHVENLSDRWKQFSAQPVSSHHVRPLNEQS